MKIGILQTGHAPKELLEPLGDYTDMFQKMLDGHGFGFETWDVVDMDFPDGPDAADGWLITGSKHGTYEDLPWIPKLEALIREIHAQRRPMVGVCFGHQIIAQALGGRVIKYPEGWSVGVTDYMLAGKPVALNAWHQDQVVERPAEARVAGSSGFCENAFLAYGDHIWTVQAHPEFGPAFIDGLIKGRGKGVVPDTQLAEAAANLNGPTQNAEMAAFMAEFFKKARA
ncbi:type 1 glutamine amidotransferase [Aestuariivita sp.]|jgi:GMP synthase (glutamine-hydrolysing)|uniref:type 1 glutamine amidotransferase n=1 Tax=Aestuariivita sp. TaxID=1872407 RepID=UPI00216C4415|nr:type 1 glutamine amidotransferase [Aestuariivita sp.]MCE8007969.1 type 1 glutamine amidotransferase [Aestuariivita sp.]